MDLCPPYAPFFGFAGVAAAVRAPAQNVNLRVFIEVSPLDGV